MYGSPGFASTHAANAWTAMCKNQIQSKLRSISKIGCRKQEAKCWELETGAVMEDERDS